MFPGAAPAETENAIATTPANNEIRRICPSEYDAEPRFRKGGSPASTAVSSLRNQPPVRHSKNLNIASENRQLFSDVDLGATCVVADVKVLRSSTCAETEVDLDELDGKNAIIEFLNSWGFERCHRGSISHRSDTRVPESHRLRVGEEVMMAVDVSHRSTMLVGEAHHRFANSLQLIVATTSGILRSGGLDSAACSKIHALQDQIFALAEVNRSLCGPYSSNSATREGLQKLCHGLIFSFDKSDTELSIYVLGEITKPDICRTVLLLVSELVMNALKHVPSGRNPKINITLTASNEDCCLIVTSNTANPNVSGGRPRVADELASAAGGNLGVEVLGEEFRVSVTLRP